MFAAKTHIYPIQQINIYIYS